MESQSQNAEFRINPENFHPCIHLAKEKKFSFSFNSFHAGYFCMLYCRQLISFKNK